MGKFIAMIALVMAVLTCAIQPAQANEKEHYSRGVDYFKTGKLDEAVIELLNAVKINPKNVEAHNRLAIIYIQQKKFKLAYRHLLNVVTLEPNRTDSQLQAAQIEMLGKMVSTAQSRVEKVLGNEPNNVKALILYAQIMAKNKNHEEAIKYLQKANKIDPKRVDVLIMLGDQYSEIEIYDKAEKSYEDALKQAPDSRIVNLVLVRHYISRNQYKRAIEVLDRAIEHSPDELTLQNLYVELLIGQRLSDEAQDKLKKLVERFPDNELYLLSLGRLNALLGNQQDANEIFLMAVRRFSGSALSLIAYAKYLKSVGLVDEAYGYLKRAANISSQSPTPQNALAEIEIERGEIELAQIRLKNTMTKFPNNATAQRLMGWMYFKQKKYEDAIKVFSEALASSPNNSDVLYNRALVYVAMNNDKLALSDLYKALKYNNIHIKASMLLANLLANNRDYKLAIDQLEKAIYRFPNNINLLDVRGRLYLKLGKQDLAKKDFAKILENEATSSIGFYNMGLLALVQGNSDDAYRWFMKSVESDPNNTNALSRAAFIQVAKGKIEKAISLVKENSIKSDKPADIHNILGQIYLNSRQYGFAEKEFRNAIKINGDMIDSWLGLHSIKIRQNDLTGALGVLKEALVMVPSNHILLVNIGQVNEQLQQPGLAEKAYREAIEVKGDFVPALNNLAYLLAEKGDPNQLSEALKIANQAQKIAGNDPRVIDTIGWILFKKGAFEDALMELDGVSKKYPDNLAIQYHLAETLFALKRNKEALTIVEKILSSANQENEIHNARDLKTRIEKSGRPE